MLSLSQMKLLDARGSVCGFLYTASSACVLTSCATPASWTAGVSRVCVRSDGKAPGKLSSSAASSFFLVLQMVPRVYTCQAQAGTLTELFSWVPSFSEFSLLPIYLFFQINISFHWIVFFSVLVNIPQAQMFNLIETMAWLLCTEPRAAQ